MEHYDESDYLQKLISTCKSRLRSNTSGMGIILYYCNYMYEFNPLTNEIRPFNSLVWYDIDSYKYRDILDYIMDIYNDMDMGIMDDVITNYVIDNNTILIDLSVLKDEIDNSDIINKKLKLELGMELNALKSKIEDIYNEWRNLALFVLNNYDGIDKILNGRINI